MFDRRDSVQGLKKLKRKSELFSSNDSLNSLLRDKDDQVFSIYKQNRS